MVTNIVMKCKNFTRKMEKFMKHCKMTRKKGTLRRHSSHNFVDLKGKLQGKLSVWWGKYENSCDFKKILNVIGA